jgi:negative regulator of sigma E activity
MSHFMIAAGAASVKAIVTLLHTHPAVLVLQRLLHVVLKLTLIAAVGFAVAVVVRKLTTPASMPDGANVVS